LRRDPVNVDEYCDNKAQELVNVHPELLHSHPESPSAFKTSLAKIQHELDTDAHKDNEWYYFLDAMVFKKWWPDRFMDL